jgi:arylsulfatase A-like enzyme
MEHAMSFRKLSVPGLLIALLISGCGRGSDAPDVSPSPLARANILLIVVDDVGYSDIGVFGSEIATPNVDALAAEGVMLTQFHVFPNCGPTRGAMMTGVDPHRAGMGGNHEVAAENQKGKPGYEGHLRHDVVTIAQLLRDAGYRTYMTGKWHLGTEANDPASRGFDKSFALMNGAASHWADQAAIIPGAKTRYTNDGKIVGQLPDDFYSSNFYTDELISYIDSASDAPFFAYLSFTAPHNPLHVPEPYIQKYRGRFDAGWDSLAAERLERLKSLGLVADDQEAQPRPEWVMAWDELTPEQQAARARDMEVYAGMIDYVDEQIGRLLAQLRQSGEYDNTLIVFMSDNGPSKTSINDYLALGDQGAAFFENFDNSADNKGLPGSSTDIGPGWAYAAATPLRLFKGYVAQGGIQVPAIVKLPGTMPNAGDRIDQVAHVMDLMPTFLSVAGAEYPAVYKGESIAPLAGNSLLPMLDANSAVKNAPREFGWSAYGMDAYRQGNWKVLRLPKPYGNEDWQLYDLARDPGEIHDLASKHTERVESLASAWDAYAESNGVVQPNSPTAYAKPIVGRKH